MAERMEPPWQEYDKEYRAFQDREGIPVHEAFYVEDVRELEVGPWDRTGGRGAFVSLEGMEGVCDAQLHVVPPQQTLEPQRHLHDVQVFVLNGRGTTTLGSGEAETSFEWGANSYFYLPRNTRYVHASLADEPVRLLTITSLPLFYTLLQDDAVIWELDGYSHWDAIHDELSYSRMGEVVKGTDSRTFIDTNFVEDVTSFERLGSRRDMGGDNRAVHFPLRHTAMIAHVLELQGGKYMKAHRHGPSATIVVLEGEGYSHLWREDHDEKTRIDWSPYSMVTPPTLWYHQHFTTTERMRYLAMHGASQGMGFRAKGRGLESSQPMNRIEYEEEEPAVREEYQRELEERGTPFRMEEVYAKEGGG